ncbi:Serine/threonine protein kinase PknB [Minicystis rosea]|nr:Serine/threonine protein kinase PknB [Minicystis rosea]
MVSAEQQGLAPQSDRAIFERRIGTTLRGKWTLERLLGVGGMAAVYVGVHKIGRRDAIKILHPEVAANREVAARFEQEAHAVNRFKHPGAVQVVDVDVTEDGAPFLVMELLDGEPLAQRMERGPMSLDDALRLVDGLLDVLGAAHAHGIIHRDIKPDNLFLLRDGRLKVLDFGIARMREGAPKTLHTVTGTIMGTLPYMPPEQAVGQRTDARADLFSVGCTLFELVAGRTPHQDHSDVALMVKMATEPAPPLATVSADASLELCMVVDYALAFDRERRYPDAATMREDIRALREGRAPPHASARVAQGDLPAPVRPVAMPMARTVRAAPPGAPAPAAEAAPPASTAWPVAPVASTTQVRTRRSREHSWLPVIAVASACLLVLLGAGILLVRAWPSRAAADTRDAPSATADRPSDGRALGNAADDDVRRGPPSKKRHHKKHKHDDD